MDLQIDDGGTADIRRRAGELLSTHQGTGNRSDKYWIDLRHWIVNRNDLIVENLTGFLSPRIDIRAGLVRQEIVWQYL